MKRDNYVDECSNLDVVLVGDMKGKKTPRSVLSQEHDDSQFCLRARETQTASRRSVCRFKVKSVLIQVVGGFEHPETALFGELVYTQPRETLFQRG